MNAGHPAPAAPDRTLSERWELKYLVSEAQASAIRRELRAFMRSDPYSEGLEGVGYPISSLYLDTPALKFCRQTLAGERNRIKLRVRGYGEDGTGPVYLEIKRKVNQTIVKRRARMDREQALSGISDPAFFQPWNCPGGGEAELFFDLARRWGAGPMMKIHYFREAYESLEDRPVRVTFDRGIRYCPADGTDFGFAVDDWNSAPVRGVVVEIKFVQSYPGWLEDILRRFSMERQTIAKYALCAAVHHDLPGWRDLARGDA